MSMSVGPSNRLPFHRPSPPPSPPDPTHYRASSSFTFHPYEHDTPHIPVSPALSNRRPPRLSAPFPTFLYASEPPPLTARNKQRVRPSAAQLAELKALYAVTPHPSRDVRESLGSRIGMRYQSVTNWFQNQRSTAKKRQPPRPPSPRSRSSRSRSRSPSRTRRFSPSPPRGGPSHLMDDNIDDSYASGDDDIQRGRSRDQHERYHDDHQSTMLRPRPRTDPVRDIIVAQAAARQQHLSELPLPLSGAAIVPSSFSDLEKHDSPSVDTAAKLALTPAPRTTSAPGTSSRAPTPLLSSFQLSRPPSPSVASTNTSTFENGTEEMHDAETDHGDGPQGDRVPRGRRSRPTPHQLAALRALHSLTSSPSIEERTRVGREIGMELGKVTNWFRNLRQTARKKERRALEAVGLRQTSKRGRTGQFSQNRIIKHSQLALDDDDDDAMSASASMSHTHSGTFDTSSTVDSVDMDYEYERPDAYFVSHRGEETLAAPRETYEERPRFDVHENTRFGPSSYDNSPQYLSARCHDNTQFEGHPEHEQDHESRSELGTESDAAHEAVTPEPQSLPPCTERIPPTPHSTATSSRGSPSPAGHSTSSLAKHPTVDDAMLLLAFHGART